MTTTRKVIAVIIIGALVAFWLVVAPKLDVWGAEAAPAPEPTTAQRMCPRLDPCSTAPVLARKFRHDRFGHSNRLVPKKVRVILDRRYKGKAINSWWDEPCRHGIIVCGGRYCQVSRTFGVTRQCLDPGWYRSRPLGPVAKVALVCGGSAVIGFFGGGGAGRFGWWGAGAGGGSCLWNRYGEKLGWND